MTYKKSSANKALRYDFLRCLKSGFVFPLLSLLIILFSGFNNIIYKDAKYYVYSLFSSEGFLFNDQSIIFGAILIGGIFMALRCFAFLRKVPSTNVYLSLPITRADLFKNRLLVAIIYYTFSSVLPLLILFILNIAHFGYTIYLLKACLYFSIAFFCAGILGFSIGALVSVCVSKRIEALFFSVFSLAIPQIIILAIDSLIAEYSNGGISNNIASYTTSSFEMFATSIAYKLNFLTPFSSINSAGHLNELEFDYEYIGIPFESCILPLLTILLFVIIINLVTPVVFNKRLAENADKVGISKFFTFLTASMLSLLTLALIISLPPAINQAVTSLIAIIVAAVVFLLSSIIMFRNKKNIIKALKGTPIVAISLSVIILMVFGFGRIYYSRVPLVDDIKCAYAISSGSDIILKNITDNEMLFGENCHDTIIGEMSTKEDLELLTSIHKDVTKQLDKGNGSFKVVYFMKDGSTIARSYYNIGNDATKKTYELYNTDSYRETLKYFLTTPSEQIEYDMDNYSQAQLEYLESLDYNQNTETKKSQLVYKQYESYKNLSSPLMYIADSSLVNSELLNKKLSDEELQELRMCLYNDYINLSTQDRFFNDKRPVNTIAVCKYEKDYSTYNPELPYDMDLEPVAPPDYATSYTFKYLIPVYENMPQTLDYLSNYNFDIPEYDANKLEVVSFYKIEDRYNQPTSIDIYLTPDYKQVKDDTFMPEAIDYALAERIGAQDFVFMRNFTQEKNEVISVYNASIPFQAGLNENDYIVRFTDDGGTIFTAYVKEENMPDLTV